MKLTNVINYVWAVVLIGAGSLFLAQNLGIVGQLSWQLWALIFAGLSLLFFASYFYSGIRQWGWLFPALIFAALAVTVPLAISGYDDPTIGAPILAAVGAPFLVAFILEPRQNWWALIPAWVMGVLTLILAIVDRTPGEVIGSLVMFAVGVPFLAVFVIDRSRWWALIPAGTLCALGLALLVMTRVEAEYVGALFVLLLALPFGAVYAMSPRNWWALIPAGVLASVGLMVLLVVGADDLSEATVSRMSAVIFLGISATFGALWIRRATQPTAWAIYPATGMAILAILAAALGTQFELVWPLALIGVGVVMLYFSLRPRRVH